MPRLHTYPVDDDLLTALAERNRLRIVELLSLAPRSVGEVAKELELRQPQATKHLQTLERAGLVTVHPLGRRRIYTLRRQPLRKLAEQLEALAETTGAADALLERYGEAIAKEQREAASDPDWALGREMRFQRELPASREDVWAHWTSAALVSEWWSPEHFEVAECEIDAVEEGRIEIVVRERDGRSYRSRGRFVELSPPGSLRFELSHLDTVGGPVFTAIHDVSLESTRALTRLTLAIRLTAASADAPAAIAGIEPGWQQLLDKLERVLEAPTSLP